MGWCSSSSTHDYMHADAVAAHLPMYWVVPVTTRGLYSAHSGVDRQSCQRVQGRRLLFSQGRTQPQCQGVITPVRPSCLTQLQNFLPPQQPSALCSPLPCLLPAASRSSEAWIGEKGAKRAVRWWLVSRSAQADPAPHCSLLSLSVPLVCVCDGNCPHRAD